MNKYKNYFRDHFGIDVSSEDVERYRQWFWPQWNFICSKVPITKKSRILEIGSGLGGVYSFVAPVVGNSNYVGLELDKDTSIFANIMFKTNVFQNESIEDFRSNGNFDRVFAFEVLEHVENPAAVITKIAQLLKKDGYFVGTSPFPYHKNIFADETHKYLLHPSNWKKLFNENGFNQVKTYPMSFFPYIWRMNKHLNIRIPFYLPFPYFISTSLIIAKR